MKKRSGIGHALGRLTGGIGRGVGYMLALLIACIVSMFASFILVRYLSPLVGPANGVNEQVVAAAVRWQNACRELVQLTAEYKDEARKAGDSSSDELRSALAEGLLPRVNDLRRRLTSVPGSDETDIMLLKAADQLAQAVANPHDVQLRLQVTEDVLAAVESVDTRVRVLDIRPQVGPVVDVQALQGGS